MILIEKSPANASRKRKNAPVQYVRPVPRVLEVRKVYRVQEENRVRQVPEDPEEKPVSVALRGLSVRRVSRVRQDLAVPKVLKECKVP
jgi:hypothetical protein